MPTRGGSPCLTVLSAFVQARSSKLSSMFRKVDEDKSGEIDRGEFRKLLSHVDPKIGDEDATVLFDMVPQILLA